MGVSTHLVWKGCELDMMLDAERYWPWYMANRSVNYGSMWETLSVSSLAGEREDGAAAELRFYRCGNAPAAEIQRVYRW